MTIIQLTKEELESTIRTAVQSEISKLQPQQQPDRLVTRKQRAQELNISLPTLAEWEKKGIIPPATRIGSRVYFKQSDLLK